MRTNKLALAIVTCAAAASCSMLPIGNNPKPTVTVTATAADATAKTDKDPSTGVEWPTNIKGLATDTIADADFHDMNVAQHEAMFITMGEQLVSSSFQFMFSNFSAVVSVTEVDFRGSSAPDAAGKDVLIRWQVRVIDPGNVDGKSFDYLLGRNSFTPNGLTSLEARPVRSGECPTQGEVFVKGKTYERCAVWTVAKPFTAVNFTTHKGEPLAYFKFAGELSDIKLIERN